MVTPVDNVDNLVLLPLSFKIHPHANENSATVVVLDVLLTAKPVEEAIIRPEEFNCEPLVVLKERTFNVRPPVKVTELFVVAPLPVTSSSVDASSVMNC